MTWQSYLSESPDKLWVRFVELSEEIAGRIEELGIIQAEEKRSRAMGYHESESTTVTGQERDASLRATEDLAEYFKRRGELEALREEQTVVRMLLERDASSEP